MDGQTQGRGVKRGGGRGREREERGGSSPVPLTKICPRRIITCFRGSPKEPLGSYPFSV